MKTKKNTVRRLRSAEIILNRDERRHARMFIQVLMSDSEMKQARTKLGALAPLLAQVMNQVGTSGGVDETTSIKTELLELASTIEMKQLHDLAESKILSEDQLLRLIRLLNCSERNARVATEEPKVH